MTSLEGLQSININAVFWVKKSFKFIVPVILHLVMEPVRECGDSGPDLPSVDASVGLLEENVRLFAVVECIVILVCNSCACQRMRTEISARIN